MNSINDFLKNAHLEFQKMEKVEFRVRTESDRLSKGIWDNYFSWLARAVVTGLHETHRAEIQQAYEEGRVDGRKEAAIRGDGVPYKPEIIHHDRS